MLHCYTRGGRVFRSRDQSDPNAKKWIQNFVSFFKRSRINLAATFYFSCPMQPNKPLLQLVGVEPQLDHILGLQCQGIV